MIIKAGCLTAKLMPEHALNFTRALCAREV